MDIDNEIKKVLDEMHEEIKQDVLRAEQKKIETFLKVCNENGFTDLDKKIKSVSNEYLRLAKSIPGTDIGKEFTKKATYLNKLLYKQEFNYLDIECMRKIDEERNY